MDSLQGITGTDSKKRFLKIWAETKSAIKIVVINSIRNTFSLFVPSIKRRIAPAIISSLKFPKLVIKGISQSKSGFFKVILIKRGAPCLSQADISITLSL